jgi:hypothetical protein
VAEPGDVQAVAAALSIELGFGAVWGHSLLVTIAKVSGGERVEPEGAALPGVQEAEEGGGRRGRKTLRSEPASRRKMNEIGVPHFP